MDISPNAGITARVINRAYVRYLSNCQESDIADVLEEAGLPRQWEPFLTSTCFAMEKIDRAFPFIPRR
jgi:hypothetical protein